MSPKRRNTYRDPDIVALIEAGGGLSDAKTLVVNQARQLNKLYRKFEKGGSSPLERLIQMASLKGFEVAPMDLDGHHDTRRDAVVILAAPDRSKGGQIFYNPSRPSGRIAFSVAHEIAHTFFPSTSGGARFREMAENNSREADELERLCHVGAAELLMPLEDFQTLAQPSWSMNSVATLANSFGSSLEATIFRLASAYPGVAVAGSASYRRTKGDEARLSRISISQTSLFDIAASGDPQVSDPKYRRQAFHTSEAASDRLIPWNKSFNLDSCVYQASFEKVESATEMLPNGRSEFGLLEAMAAPYQYSPTDGEHPDILFLWKQN